MARRMHLRAGLAVLASMMIGTAEADDWTGLYAGGSIGVDAIADTASIVRPDGEAAEVDSWLGGDLGATLFAGYDHQLTGSIVAGAFLAYDWSSIETTASGEVGDKSAHASLVSLGRSWTLAGRIGVRPSDATLLYALLGYSWVSLDDVAVSAPGFAYALELPDFAGLAVGAGLEHRLSGNLSLRAEYRQAMLGEEEIYADDVAGRVSLEPTLHTARVGVAYRLGGAEGGEPGESPGTGSGLSGLHLGAGGALTAIVQDLHLHSELFSASADVEGIGGASFTGGVTVGYDMALGERWLAGPLLSYETALYEPRIEASGGGASGSIDLLNVGRAVTAGVRLGYALSPSVLAYGLVGYTWLDLSDIEARASDGTHLSYDLPEMEGVMVGIGFERALTGMIALRSEYRYTALGEESLVDAAPLVEASLDAELHAARVELVVRPGL